MKKSSVIPREGALIIMVNNLFLVKIYQITAMV